MLDISKTIVIKSDQLNADDLIGGSRNIRIRDIKATKSAEQPLSIYFDDDNNKPYKPSLGMRKVLLKLWGKDGDEYVGRSITLFRDDSVKWAGEEVGGIRISHMSDIKEEKSFSLTVSKTKKVKITIKKMVIKAPVIKSADELQTEVALELDRIGKTWEEISPLMDKIIKRAEDKLENLTVPECEKFLVQLKKKPDAKEAK